MLQFQIDMKKLLITVSIILLFALPSFGQSPPQSTYQVLETGVPHYIVQPDNITEIPAMVYSDHTFTECGRDPRILRTKVPSNCRVRYDKPCSCPPNDGGGYIRVASIITHSEMENMIRTSDISQLQDTIYVGHGQELKKLHAPSGSYLNAYVSNYIKSLPKPIILNDQDHITPERYTAATPAITYANIQFEFDSSILRPSSHPILDATSADLRSSGRVVYLNGYASAGEGTAAHNMQLSRDRANSVKTYLVNSGVDAKHLIIKGYGATHPIADNSTEEGRVLNRRVEFKK